MRALFTDGTNSAAHFSLGLIQSKEVAIVFVVYQLLQGDENVTVDIAEFVTGWLSRSLLRS